MFRKEPPVCLAQTATISVYRQGGFFMAIVIIPAYQPDENLVSLVEELQKKGLQSIVVDDGSGENYQPLFKRIKEIGLVLSHPKNYGKGAAIKTALTFVRQELWDCQVVGIMDADGQHLPEDMLRLLETAKKNKHTLVLGVRDVGKDMPVRSRLGNQITRIVFKIVSGVRLTDTQTGLRAFGWELVDEMLEVAGERYEYETNVLLTMAKKKIPIKEVTITTIYHDNNSGSHFRPFKDSVRIYKDILRFTLSSFSSFLLDYLLFFVFMLVLPHTAPAIMAGNVMARLISAFYNYSMNCCFVFYKNRSVTTAVDYFMLAAFILLMNNVILEFFTQTAGISVYPAKVMTESILFLLSLFVQKFMIFRKKSTSVSTEEMLQEKKSYRQTFTKGI